VEVEDLMTIIREDYLDDAVKPYRWSPERLYRWLDMAQKEACRRQPLIVDTTTPAVCDLAVTAMTAAHTLHPRIHLVEEVRYDGSPLPKMTPAMLDRQLPGWETADADLPLAWTQNELTLTLVPPPAQDLILNLRVWRLPLVDVTDAGATLEIPEAYHEDLAHYVAARAYWMPDEDLRDTQLAERHDAEFAAVFGPALRADVLSHRRRETNTAHIQHGHAYHGRRVARLARNPFDYE